MLYTGGTTGMPKGVMWRHDDLFARLNSAGFRRYPEDGGARRRAGRAGGAAAGDDAPAGLPADARDRRVHRSGMPQRGGPGGHPHLPDSSIPIELLDTVEREQVNGLIIVGDAFAKPILATLDAHPGRWDLSSLVGIISSGVMWSEETKQGLLRHHPGMLLVDAFSSSEAIGMGTSVSSGSSAAHTARVQLWAPRCGSSTPTAMTSNPAADQNGVLALGGRIPLGYYKDEAKTAATFRTIDGSATRYPATTPRSGADGSIHLLGRGSVVINTGGREGLPRRGRGGGQDHARSWPTRWWSASPTTASARRSWPWSSWRRPRNRARYPTKRSSTTSNPELAGYKAPRRVRFVDTIGRSPAGKLDYARHRAEAIRVGQRRLRHCRAPTPRKRGGGRRGQPLLAPWVRTKSLTT
jgi:acyl-CoA synthetase (AMP-forming)/AMP-acid ligase II